jgi:Formate-tetrahydrofolate ligase (EC 6.3.4.3)
MKLNGGAKDPSKEDVEKLKEGAANLLMHVNLIKKYGIEPVVALNRFPSDTKKEIEVIAEILKKEGINFALSEVFGKGGVGGLEVGNLLLKALENKPKIIRTYEMDDSPKDKIEKICTRVYGASKVIFTKQALKDLQMVDSLGLNGFHVCMAKTQYSISDNPKLLGWPKNFKVTVKSVRISNGAGFIVPMLGDIMTMPGLPAHPAAENVDVDEEGRILNLF